MHLQNIIKSYRLIIVLFIITVLFSACAKHVTPTYPTTAEKKLSRMAYAIQAGAFSKVENAGRLTAYLNGYGLNAYYFVYKKGLYKVRFGNFSTKDDARLKAESLISTNIIREYYIVKPEEYSVSRGKKYGENYIRNEIVKTAQSFIGVPYRWGGASEKRGFDCSGLTMAVYKLNGLNLPRTSQKQYETGAFQKRKSLLKGDLVFFDIYRRGKISHVGLYAGGDKFIHAPRTGQKVRVDSLSNTYYKKRYAGAKTYL
jgi:hypothetical protein